MFHYYRYFDTDTNSVDFSLDTNSASNVFLGLNGQPLSETVSLHGRTFTVRHAFNAGDFFEAYVSKPLIQPYSIDKDNFHDAASNIIATAKRLQLGNYAENLDFSAVDNYYNDIRNALRTNEVVFIEFGEGTLVRDQYYDYIGETNPSPFGLFNLSQVEEWKLKLLLGIGTKIPYPANPLNSRRREALIITHPVNLDLELYTETDGIVTDNTILSIVRKFKDFNVYFKSSEPDQVFSSGFDFVGHQQMVVGRGLEVVARIPINANNNKRYAVSQNDTIVLDNLSTTSNVDITAEITRSSNNRTSKIDLSSSPYTVPFNGTVRISTAKSGSYKVWAGYYLASDGVPDFVDAESVTVTAPLPDFSIPPINLPRNFAIIIRGDNVPPGVAFPVSRLHVGIGTDMMWTRTVKNNDVIFTTNSPIQPDTPVLMTWRAT